MSCTYVYIYIYIYIYVRTKHPFSRKHRWVSMVAETNILKSVSNLTHLIQILTNKTPNNSIKLEFIPNINHHTQSLSPERTIICVSLSNIMAADDAMAISIARASKGVILEFQNIKWFPESNIFFLCDAPYLKAKNTSNTIICDFIPNRIAPLKNIQLSIRQNNVLHV